MPAAKRLPRRKPSNTYQAPALSIAKRVLTAGMVPSKNSRRSGPSRAADLISSAASDRGLHQTLIEARSGGRRSVHRRHQSGDRRLSAASAA
jgi:hypothetical protein